jgi:hypothetical protein
LDTIRYEKIISRICKNKQTRPPHSVMLSKFLHISTRMRKHIEPTSTGSHIPMQKSFLETGKEWEGHKATM